MSTLGNLVATNSKATRWNAKIEILLKQQRHPPVFRGRAFVEGYHHPACTVHVQEQQLVGQRLVVVLALHDLCQHGGMCTPE